MCHCLDINGDRTLPKANGPRDCHNTTLVCRDKLHVALIRRQDADSLGKIPSVFCCVDGVGRDEHTHDSYCENEEPTRQRQQDDQPDAVRRADVACICQTAPGCALGAPRVVYRREVFSRFHPDTLSIDQDTAPVGAPVARR